MYERSFEVTGAVDGYLPTDKIVEFRVFGSGEVYAARGLISCPEWGRLREWIDVPAKARFLARSSRPDLADPQYWLADLESTNPPYKRVEECYNCGAWDVFVRSDGLCPECQAALLDPWGIWPVIIRTMTAIRESKARRKAAAADTQIIEQNP